MAKLIGPKDYYHHRPAKQMRKLGDALLASTQTFGGGITLAQLTSTGPMDKTMLWIALVTMFLGAVGKFLTNFYSDDE